MSASTGKNKKPFTFYLILEYMNKSMCQVPYLLSEKLLEENSLA